MTTVSRHPTTTGQASLWMADQIRGCDGSHNVLTLCFVSGPAGREDIDRAVHALLAGTPVLRIRMGVDSSGEIRQWFSPDPVAVHWLDRSVAGFDHNGTSRVDQYLAREFDRPYDSDGGPLAKVVIAPTDDGGHVVAFGNHHLVMDGASQSELVHRFAAAMAGRPSSSTEDDYVHAAHLVRAAEEQARETDLDHWVERLAGVSAFSWRPDVPRTTAAGHSRGRLTRDAVVAARVVADACGTSLFTVLVSAVHQVLHDHSVEPPLVCVPTSVRPAGPVGAAAMGYFVNSVPLVATDGAAGGLADFVGRYGQRWSADLKRRHLPFRVLSEHTAAMGGLSAKLDRVFVTYRNMAAPHHSDVSGSRVVADLFVPRTTPATDLSARIMREDGDVACELVWDVDQPAELCESFADLIGQRLMADMGGRRTIGAARG